MSFAIGLDLGQAADYTALAVIERVEVPTGERFANGRPKTERDYHIRHLERFPLGTPYPSVAARVAALMATGPLAGHTVLVADATGVGAPVIDLLRQFRTRPVAVTITGGFTATADDSGGWRVPKRDLVSTVQVLLQSGRLKCAPLPEAGLLQRELLAFRVKIDPATAHDSYGAWREGEHDDLVLAVALACWYVVNHLPGPLEIATGSPRAWTDWTGAAI